MRSLIISRILGCELRSRNSARKLVSEITFDTTLDFQSVVFMSRSFADELYNIRLEFPGIGFMNMSSDLQQMFKAVSMGRQIKRNRNLKQGDVEDISSMKDLKQYFEGI